MNDFLGHMGGYVEWLSKITCRFVELQVLGRNFLLIPQKVVIFAILADMKSLG